MGKRFTKVCGAGKIILFALCIVAILQWVATKHGVLFNHTTKGQNCWCHREIFARMKISIIIPYKENRGWLDDCIRSIETQSYKNFEIIESCGPGGVSENLNNGLDKCTGDLIRYVCDDDLLTRDSLYKTKTMWPAGSDFIHSNAVNFNSENNAMRSATFPRMEKPTLHDMLLKNCLHGGTVVYHARCFENGNRFDTSLWTGEEYEFNMRLLASGMRIGYINAFTYLYRRHEGQKSVGNHGAEYQRDRFHAINEIKERFKG